MTKKQNVKDILDAIKSVKFRAVSAFNLGELNEYTKLMGDLLALEVCLVGATESYIEEEEETLTEEVKLKKAV
jgi:hypothetical protein